jgi:tRNA/tmRNA/rRNA uracil-C5-methylase (TrmA/RlmC/RlmD family)
MLIKQLFPDENNIDFSKLKITVESTYSVTPPNESDKIINFMKKYINKDLTRLVITDATTNAGGNTLSFSKYYKHVHSVEIDKETFEYLKHIIKIQKIAN